MTSSHHEKFFQRRRERQLVNAVVSVSVRTGRYVQLGMSFAMSANFDLGEGLLHNEIQNCADSNLFIY